jgi:competence protein ComEA
MIMKRKYIIAGLTCGFLCITGICYSCAYSGKAATVLVPGQNTRNQDMEESGTGAASDAAAGSDVPTEDKPAEDSAAIEGGPEDSASGGASGNREQSDAQKKLIFVHVCGAVVKPGVYQAQEGARLVDLLELSGGLTGEAAGDYINQAEQVMDGQRIYVPTMKEVEDISAEEYLNANRSAPAREEASAFVNINTADAGELMSLPGIGEAKANSIIEYRKANGSFKTIEELMNIPGIKEGLFHQISTKIVAD